ncbi:MAG: hypothetical protein BWY89_01658 [Bacteroidetes bacterium ADurb.BinA012]|nr:MAG: hypothetical protein BWY89_01658 [Bacteroidetes bacterium ADurb.BinA012]
MAAKATPIRNETMKNNTASAMWSVTTRLPLLPKMRDMPIFFIRFGNMAVAKLM